MNEAEQRGCDLVRAFFSALSDGDLEAVRMLLHPDATWEVMRAVPGERLSVGRDAIIDGFVAPVRGRFVPGDPKVTVRTVFASGDVVAAETQADGTMLDGSEYRRSHNACRTGVHGHGVRRSFVPPMTADPRDQIDPPRLRAERGLRR